MNPLLSSSELYREACKKLSSSNISNAKNEAAWILEFAAGLTRLLVHTSPDHVVSDDNRERVLDCIARRASGEPLQYIIGSQDFWGRDFMVSRSVLIPRPETELLVQAALERLRGRSSPLIVDVGTGSGCLAITLNEEIPSSIVLAMERNPMAIRIAQHNAWLHGQNGDVRFCVGDLLAPLLSTHLVGKVTAIVANLPYIREDEFPTLSREVIDFEPKMALVGGPDGLSLYRRLLPEAEKVLAANGHLLLEVGRGQASRLCEEVNSVGNYHVNEIIHDSLGIQRVICLERKG
ncbi:MAG: peptide chain release factor N(5)-glutamine methyltransferase [Nitrospirales bacterium]